MILRDFLRALGQLGDHRFRRVLWLGLGLSLALLFGAYALFLWLLQVLTPETVTLPVLGEVRGLDQLLSWASILFMTALSIFLMVPVASAFAGLFLEDVAQAVEDRHYPGLPPVPRLPLGQTLVDTANFVGLLVVVNLASLALFPFAGPLAPVLFWGVNGFLLGREYFQLVAMRRLGRAGAIALRRRHGLQIWLAGTLMAAPLSIPLLNLLIPVLGAATFTHLFHRLAPMRRD